ncbi:hypothetical protein TrLO_g3035 [Triparma laevis f. longispina]|uniref:Uncharacterized protein n=1 Tax=Triparma laevis f. longispina TaxID=1714387 RepID=A0A9W7E9L0_9STRA|nr:hypothetical protein TrLO_g3035 [Triparma laevis f. longispina]
MSTCGGRVVNGDKSEASSPDENFFDTDAFRRHFVGFLPVEDSFCTMQFLSKEWQVVAKRSIDEDFTSGELLVHDGKDVGGGAITGSGIPDWGGLKAKREPVKRVMFLLNITKVGKYACHRAVNLVVVDIPEGVESIDREAFWGCLRLTTVSFPTTLTAISDEAFWGCSNLDNVDLLHTNLQELENQAFQKCSELKSMTIPDSLQTLGSHVFHGCSKLVPSNIHTLDNDAVIAHLRSHQNNPN